MEIEVGISASPSWGGAGSSRLSWFSGERDDDGIAGSPSTGRDFGVLVNLCDSPPNTVLPPGSQSFLLALSLPAIQATG